MTNRPINKQSFSPLPVSLLSRPWLVALFSILGASLYALYMLRSPAVRASMFDPSGSFMYVVPIVVPFVAFLFDRYERLRQLNRIHYLIDVAVVLTAMWRVIGNVPYVSGHTLFLTYALISSKSNVVRVFSVLVLIQAMYLKYFVWHDWVTSTVGIVLGSTAALVVLKLGPQASSPAGGDTE
ncbi:MAG TPA: hypothetical protein VI306_14355 [Pyrinomonadaceae bacterium]